MSMFLRASLMLKAVHVSTIKLVNQNVNHIGVQEKRTETPPLLFAYVHGDRISRTHPRDREKEAHNNL